MVLGFAIIAMGCGRSPGPPQSPSIGPTEHGRNDDENALIRILAKQLGKKSSEIRPGQSLQDLGADELDLIEAVMALEQQLQISIANEALVRAVGSSKREDVLPGLTVEKLAAVVGEARRAPVATPKPGASPGSAEPKPAAAQPAPVRIADIAKDYTHLRPITADRVFVNPELAMLCQGASAQEVAKAKEKHGPHAHTSIRVFMNDLAATAFGQSSTPYPVGSIIVKEKSGLSYNPETGSSVGGRTHDGVGGMVKRPPGFDAEHGDWEYFYFEDQSKIESGKIASCVGCHGGAAQRDYVFGDWAKKRG